MDIGSIPLHPMVVHFPIALFISAMVLEILSRIFKKESLHQTALQLFIFATFITPFVALTGLWEANEEHLVRHRVLDLHKFFAFATMILSLLSLGVLWFL